MGSTQENGKSECIHLKCVRMQLSNRPVGERLTDLAACICVYIVSNSLCWRGLGGISGSGGKIGLQPIREVLDRTFWGDVGTCPVEQVELIANEVVDRDFMGPDVSDAGESTRSSLRSKWWVNRSGIETDKPVVALALDGSLDDGLDMTSGLSRIGMFFGGGGGGIMANVSSQSLESMCST